MSDSANARQQYTRLEALFSSLDFGIISITLGGIVETWNKGAERIFGYSAEEITGRSIAILAPSETSLDYLDVLERVGAAGELNIDAARVRKDGSTIEVALSLTPIRDASGELTGIAAIAQDIADRKRKEQVVRQSEIEYGCLFNSNPVPMWVFDRSNLHFLAVNDAAAQQYGYSRSEFLGMTIADIRPPETVPELLRDIAERREGLQSRACWKHRGKSGHIFDVEIVCHDLQFRGADAMLVAAYDVTEQKQAREAARRAEEKYRVIFDETVIGIFQLTPDGRPLDLNPALAHMHGYDSPAQLLSEVPDVAAELFVNPQQLPDLMRAAEKETVRNAEVELYRRDRSRIWVMINFRAVRDNTGKVILCEGTAEDITDRKAAEEQVRFLAYHDALTELPNRTLFNDRLDVALAGARRKSEQLAVLFLDLDRFKNINDLLGHSVGDQMLVDVATRLIGCVREQDTIARVGGDEFLILLPGISAVEEAEIAARRIMHAMNQPFLVQGRTLNTSCSIGISLFPDNGRDAETLIRNADAAMYRAKDEGPDNVQCFSAEMNSRAIERWTLENDLRQALERGEFLLVYQPQMEISSGRITGMEALIRWQHPKQGLISPERFIPIAENCGLIFPIGEWVLRTACSEALEWQNHGISGLTVAVNVSAAQFRSRDFCTLLEKVLNETGLSPQSLELELTEGLLLSNADVVHTVLDELRDMGIALAIDDFGTGYSSLSYLKQLQVKKLKIDRSFMREVASDGGDAAITTAIISLGKSLNLRVVAEGVETEEQFSFLRQKGCDEMQGYYLSKPVPACDVSALILSLRCSDPEFASAPNSVAEAKSQ